MSRKKMAYNMAMAVVGIVKSLDSIDFKGCEVGVWEGATSKVLLDSFPSLRLSLVDPWDVSGVQMNVRKQTLVDAAKKKALENTEFAKDRREVFHMPSLEAVLKFKDGSLDFVFIDAHHNYEFVRDDILAWFPKVREGGILLGHDYDNKWERLGKWGVKRAVDEFGNDRGLKIDLHPSQLWSIQK